MLDREPFLKAIFAAPTDDLPRLVFADWLEENGDPTWAELIRVGCQWNQLPRWDVHRRVLHARMFNLARVVREANSCHIMGSVIDRGFADSKYIQVGVELLSDANEFRLTACRDHPEWYGATHVIVGPGLISTPTPLKTFLTSPVFEHVTELDLGGREERVEPSLPDTDGGFAFQLLDFIRRPTIHPRMVDALAGMRECRRLTDLDLRNNDLDNMALNALADSPYFTRLKKLRLSEGQRFRGRAWQRVLVKFGEDVAE